MFTQHYILIEFDQIEEVVEIVTGNDDLTALISQIHGVCISLLSIA